MTIEQIKSRLTIKEILHHYSLTPNRNNLLACPWHDDKTPSLQIYPKTNTWTCFSSNCDAGSGDVIDFIMKYEKITKHEAILKATELCGGEIKTSIQLSRVAILTKYYQGTLHAIHQSKKAQAYVTSRGLDYNQLNIGFCGYGIGKKWNKDLYQSAEQLGVFKIRNCIIFPTKNKEGQIVNIYGRSVSANPKIRHFYLQGGLKGLYPGYPKSDTTKLLLTESIIDAASLMQHQAIPVLALYGTTNFTKEHDQAIKDLELLEEVILFFDGDKPGKEAAQKYHQRIKQLRPDIKVSYVDTPKGEDPNSLIISHQPEILTHLIESRLFFSSEKSTEKEKGRHQPPPPKGALNTSNPELIIYETNLLHIVVMGGIKITGLDRLRVTLKIEKREYSHHLPVRHSLDLYHSKQVEMLTQKMAEGLEIGTSESQRTISHLTGLLEEYRQRRLEQLKPKKSSAPTMTEAERASGMKYLKDPKLLRNTLEDIAKSGIVGETNNSLIAYLAYTSRKRKKPLHIMCLGASGTGKTYLQEMVSALIPEGDKLEITALSDNAFYYFGREELKHKLILIEDLDGAQNAEYPLREIQTKRRISKTVTIKNNKGIPKTINVTVEGPVCVSGCTTREKLYEDNANRCILLYIDDSKEQDRRIMEYQQKASADIINATQEAQIRQKLQNTQRLLRPIKVVNPYAQIIDLPEEVFKPRRTLLLLLSFIETITYYHQYQRAVKTNEATGQAYIETTKEDIAAAFSLMKEVLFSKSDELTKASRKFLERLKGHVANGQVFYTQEIRKRMRISSSTVHRYIRELQQNGYIKYKGGNKFRGYEYQIVDYEEYKKLKDDIDQKLADILSKIESSSGVPVSQKYPTKESGINKPQTIKELV